VELFYAVGLFVGTGLTRGEAAVIIATPEHISGFVAAFGRMEINAEAHLQAGNLVLLDAQQILDKLMHAGKPDPNRFQRVLGSVMGDLYSRGYRAIRAYGEMVSLLWNRGDCEAAIRLEEQWNDFIGIHPMTLFCAYMLDGLDHGAYGGPLSDIGRTHTDVLATRDDERLRAAIDAATEEVLGISLSLTLSFSGREQNAGEHRLPLGRRTMLWLQRNMPGSSRLIMERARHYYEDSQSHAARSALQIG
jgi:hypothetical protein